MNHVYHNSGAKIVKFNDMALYGSALFKNKTLCILKYKVFTYPRNNFTY
tara:strand:- start:13472 stop:13618 length:147 start_codon:yes stop_codon:yes gene_type:complete